MTLMGYLQFPNIDPVMVRLGPLAIRWYGVAYLAGFALAYAWLRKMVKDGSLRISVERLNDVMSWLVLGIIVGGRLGWWVFYHRDEGVVEPWYAPFAIWEGGMSFHGGLIGVATVIGLWTWRTKSPVWNLLDCAAVVTPIGLCLGRIANFINAELVGRVTTVPWAVLFPAPHNDAPRHPSQLYEAMLEGPVLLLLVWSARRWLRPREGRVAAIFVMGYGLIRFSVEFTREPDPQLGFIAFGWLTMGQLLSLVIALAGAGLWVAMGRRRGELVNPGNK